MAAVKALQILIEQLDKQANKVAQWGLQNYIYAQ